MQLSIIVSVYKVEKYIREYMESIFQQGMTDDIFELIIINDGTPDRSIDVIADIISAHDNIRVVNQENQGLSVALNMGISIAQGEYILFNDPDDLLIDNSVGPLLAEAMVSKPDIALADYTTFTDEAPSTCRDVSQNDMHIEEKTGKELLLESLNPYHCYKVRMLFRRNFLIKNNIRFVPGIYFQDVPFVHECYLRAQRCIRTHWKIYLYRQSRHGSATNSFSYKKAIDFCIVIQELWKLSQMKGITNEERLKVRNDAFTSLSFMVESTVKHIESPSERLEIINQLHKTTRHMHFSKGWKQRTATFLLHHAPHLYLTLQEKRKQSYEPEINKK